MKSLKALESLRKLKSCGIPLELVEDVNENPLVGTLFHDAYLEGFFDEHGYYPTGDELDEPVVKKLDKDTKKAS
jgi:hypothetical protein